MSSRADGDADQAQGDRFIEAFIEAGGLRVNSSKAQQPFWIMGYGVGNVTVCYCGTPVVADEAVYDGPLNGGHGPLMGSDPGVHPLPRFTIFVAEQLADRIAQLPRHVPNVGVNVNDHTGCGLLNVKWQEVQ